MIAAIGRKRELGKGNDLLWKIPDDLKRFRDTTKGHPILMGRKTYDSIGRPLPHRTNIVITRDINWKAEGVLTADSVEEGIRIARLKPGNDEIFIIGGGQIYALGLPIADKLYLTIVDDEKEADSFFPEYERFFTKKTFEESRETDGLKYSWVDFERA